MIWVHAGAGDPFLASDIVLGLNLAGVKLPPPLDRLAEERMWQRWSAE